MKTLFHADVNSQAELFATTIGNITAIKRLPGFMGDLTCFNILKIDATHSNTSSKFVNELLKLLGKYPTRNPFFQADRIREAFKEFQAQGLSVIIVIENADVWPEKNFPSCKRIIELYDIGLPPNAGIVLTGNMDMLRLKINDECSGIRHWIHFM